MVFRRILPCFGARIWKVKIWKNLSPSPEQKSCWVCCTTRNECQLTSKIPKHKKIKTTVHNSHVIVAESTTNSQIHQKVHSSTRCWNGPGPLAWPCWGWDSLETQRYWNFSSTENHHNNGYYVSALDFRRILSRDTMPLVFMLHPALHMFANWRDRETQLKIKPEQGIPKGLGVTTRADDERLGAWRKMCG